ncbi:MAG: hypothetical protein RLZ04_2490 [Actinomycetota bacterium]
MSDAPTELLRPRPAAADPVAAARRFEQVLDSLRDAVVVFEPVRDEAGAVVDAHIAYWNAAASRTYRSRIIEPAIAGKSMREIGLATIDVMMGHLSAAADGTPQIQTMDNTTGRFSGALFRYGQALWLPTDEGMVVMVVQDLSEELESMLDIERANTFRRAIIDTVRDPVIVWERREDGSILAVEANAPAARWLTRPTPCGPESLMIDSALTDQLHIDLDQVTRGNHVVQRTVALATPNPDDPVAARLVHSPLPGAMVFTQFIDVTEELRQSLEFARRLRLDDDTGLLNRIGFEESLSDRLAAGYQDLVILAVQFDQLESVEQRLGVAAVGEVLSTISASLEELVPHALALGRVAYGTFACLVATSDPRRRWQRIAPAIDDRFAMPITVAGLQLHLGATIGISSAVPTGTSAADLLRRARLAAGEAHSRAHSTAVWDESMDTRHPERIEILGDVSRAIDNDEFTMLFQPKLDLEGRLHGAEALVRWQHPTKGMISPADYIEFVEESTLVSRFTKVTLEAALNGWHRSGLPGRVAVNIPASMLSDPALCDIVDEVIVATVCPTRKVALEITERGVLESNPHVDRNIETLRSRGIVISIDDFGTGGSSLTYLRRVALDEVKIDRQFISALDNDVVNRAIVGAVVGIARTLGFSVVAEGVETHAELDAARALGCNVFQGYGIARPLALADLLPRVGPDGEFGPPQG